MIRRRRRPQALPTRSVRGLVEGGLRLIELIPGLRDAMRPKQVVAESDVPITLLMPVHVKDLWIASSALKFARKNARHPIVETVIVGKACDRIRAFADEQKARLVPESEVLGYGKEKVLAELPDYARDRGSWVFQQLLKLAADRYVRSGAFLVIDADTLLLHPRVFKQGKTLWIDYSHERNFLYLRGYRELLGQTARFPLSLVCHHMFGEIKVLRALQKDIEEHTGKSWDQAIIDLAGADCWSEKQRQVSPFNYFSEYETYGNYARLYYRDIRYQYFRNHAAREYDSRKLTPEEYVKSLPVFFQWASFHSYHHYDHADERD